MPNTTAKIGFNTFLENDVLDFEKVNENFEKLDKMLLCVESGEKTATYSGDTSGNATWKYRKYSDGSIDFYTKLELSNTKCSNGSSTPYYSGTFKVLFPFQLTSVDDVQMHVSSTSNTWIADVTDRSIVDNVSFNILSSTSESAAVHKTVYISVKGR